MSASSDGPKDSGGKEEEMEGTSNENLPLTNQVDVTGESGDGDAKQEQEANDDAIEKTLEELSPDSFENFLEAFSKSTMAIAIGPVLSEIASKDEPFPTVSASSPTNHNNYSRVAKLSPKNSEPKQHTAITMEEEPDNNDGESIEMESLQPIVTDNGDDNITDKANEIESQEANFTDSDSVEGPSADAHANTNRLEEDASVDDTGSAGGQLTGHDKCTQTIPVKISPADDGNDPPNEEEVAQVEPIEEVDNDEVHENSNTNEVAVPIPLEDDEYAQSKIQVGHMECYLEIANRIGVSSYRREEYDDLNMTHSNVLKVVFLVISVAALLQMIHLMKLTLFYVAQDKDLKECVRFGYALIRFLTRCFYIHLVAFCATKISMMLLHLRQLKKFQTNDDDNQRFSRLAIVMGVTSIVGSVITSVLAHVAFDEWSLEEVLHFRSYEMSHTLFVWSYNNNYENYTNYLFDKYYLGEFTPGSLAIGFSESFLDFCATLQGAVIRDSLMIAAIILYTGWKYFARRIQPQISIHPNNCDPSELEDTVRHFKALRLSNASMNAALSAVLSFITVESLFLFAYMFVKILKGEYVNMRFISNVIDAIKTAVMFYMALRTSYKNGDVTNWLRLMTKYTGPVDVEGILGMTIQAALDALREVPLGFGTEYFLINQAFLVGFCAALTSIISILVESEHQNELLHRLY